MHCEHEKIDLDCDKCQAAMEKSMVEAGIPVRVIRGEKKLKDCFSKEYIDLQRNIPVENGGTQWTE